MNAARSHVYWNGTFAQCELSSIVSQQLPGALDGVLSQMGNLQPVTDDLAPFLWLDQKYYLADDILVKSDRMSMAHSVEVRPPFLDHRIVEFAATLPADLKILGSRQKIVLKELMKRKLPPSIVNRGKIGFDIPAHEWLRGPLLELLEETLEFGLAEYGQLFCQDGIENLKKRHLQRRVNVGYHLWGLLILFLWMKKWKVKI